MFNLGYRFLLLALLVLKCGCGSFYTVAQVKPAKLLPEDGGAIAKVFCFGGVESNPGSTDFFIENSKTYAPCVVHPVVISGTFLTKTSLRGQMGMDSLLLNQFDWNDNNFTEDSLNLILENHDNLNTKQISSWIEFSQPFTQTYSLVDFGESKLIDLDSMSPEQRFDFQLGIADGDELLPRFEKKEIVWKYSETNFTPFSVRKKNLVNVKSSAFYDVDSTLTPKEKITLLMAQHRYTKMLKDTISKKFNEKALQADHSAFPVLIQSNRICYCNYSPSGNRDCASECDIALATKIGAYLQDRLHARVSDHNLAILNTSRAELIFNNYCEKTNDWASWLRSTPCTGNSQGDLLCAVAGGNMFVTSDVVFLGTDEQNKLLNNRQVIDSLGLSNTRNINISYVNNALLSAVYGDPTGKRVVWVGTEGTTKTFSINYTGAGKEARQPIYHIDLFFNPIGRVSDSNMDFYYLIGVPFGFGKYANTSTKAAELKRSLDKINQAIAGSLTSFGYNPKPIEIPVGVNYEYKDKYEVVMFVAFCNGIFERRNDTLNYLLPRYTERTMDDYWKQYQIMEAKAIKNLNDSLLQATGNKFKCIPVSSASHQGDSALRCQVKVIKRR